MRYVILLLLLWCIGIEANSQEKVTMRQRYLLDKGWKFHLGDVLIPEIKGHSASYHNAKAGKAWGPAAPNYDDSDWRMLNLPHDWAVEQPFNPEANLSQGFRDRGIGWYRRTFKVSSKDKGCQFELQLDGMATYATIWVNGTLLHRNWCGYTSSYIDVTPYLTYDNNLNTISIRVDAQSQEGWWYEGAGIYRHTWLLKRSPVHIKTDGVFANPIKQSDNRWLLPVEVEMTNAGRTNAEVEVKVTLLDKENKICKSISRPVMIEVLRDNKAAIALNIEKPELWDVDNPICYTVKTELFQNGVLVDETNTKCGFRYFHFDANSGFYLNGRHLKLKGVCNHQDHAGVGVAIPEALLVYRLNKLKEMGANAYRCAHNPASREFMEICDSIGILVMNENRVFNTSPEYVRQLQWLVKRDRNSPSVFLWSVFNEEPMQGTENGVEMVRRMSDVVKQLDTTRPVTAAMNGGLFEPHNVSQVVDVVGFNYQHSSYDRFHQANPTMKMTSSEDISAFQVRGEYVTDKSKNIIDSYDTECAGWGQTHRQGWKEIDTRPYLAGGFVWTGFDYRGEPTPFKWPSASSFFGIMDLCGFPKMAFHLKKAQWRQDIPVLNIVPHWNWPSDSIGKKIKVMTLTNADSVRIYLNGKLMGSEKVDKYDMNTFYIPYKPGRLEAIGYKCGQEYIRYKVETTGEPYKINLSSDRMCLKGDGIDAIPITVEVLDKKKCHVPTANLPIEFEISGPGKIIGLGNGNPNSHEPEKGKKRSLFNGFAQVIIQAEDGAEEPIVLTAKTEGKIIATSIKIQTEKVVPIKSIAVVQSSLSIGQWHVSPITSHKPDVKQSVSENDMNSWQLTNSGTLWTLSGGEYCIYRYLLKPYSIHKKQGGVILFKGVCGEAEFWIGDKLVTTKDTAECSDIDIPFSAVDSILDIRILFKGNNSEVGLRYNAIINK